MLVPVDSIKNKLKKFFDRLIINVIGLVFFDQRYISVKFLIKFDLIN